MAPAVSPDFARKRDGRGAARDRRHGGLQRGVDAAEHRDRFVLIQPNQIEIDVRVIEAVAQHALVRRRGGARRRGQERSENRAAGRDNARSKRIEGRKRNSHQSARHARRGGAERHHVRHRRPAGFEARLWRVEARARGRRARRGNLRGTQRKPREIVRETTIKLPPCEDEARALCNAPKTLRLPPLPTAAGAARRTAGPAPRRQHTARGAW